MTAQCQAVLDAALALPEVDRALLVERLLETLSPEPDDLSDDQLYAELERRSADFDQGTADAIPWSELKKQD
jgi:putative addiction module component (TIGR02574 family)